MSSISRAWYSPCCRMKTDFRVSGVVTAETAENLGDGTQKDEELYTLARESYASSEKRFDDAESKIWRYLSILFIVLGLAAFGADRIRTLLVPNPPLPNILFGVFSGAFYFFGLASFSYFVRALRLHTVSDLVLEGELISSYFDRYTRAAALRGLAPAFFSGADTFRIATQQKLRLAHRGFNSLLIAVGFALAAAGSYLFVQIPEACVMTQPSNGGSEDSAKSESTDQKTPQPSSDAAQAAEDAKGLFENLQKGFEGGQTRDKK